MAPDTVKQNQICDACLCQYYKRNDLILNCVWISEISAFIPQDYCRKDNIPVCLSRFM